MVDFAAFQDTLPDPNNTIGDAGQIAGLGGPGFASVQLTSDQPTMKDITNSGRLLGRAVARHRWKISISYNPMTQAEFMPVYSFIANRRGSIKPFFVSLPQHRVPQEGTFATYAASNNLEATASYAAGTTQVLIGKTGYSNTTNKTPTPGDLFTIDGANSNHKKTYMVTRVQTTADYETGTTQPQATQVKIDFMPGFAKAVSNTDDFVFHNPLIKVIAQDVQQYSLNTNNLYSYKLDLEEVQ